MSDTKLTDGTSAVSKRTPDGRAGRRCLPAFVVSAGAGHEPQSFVSSHSQQTGDFAMLLPVMRPSGDDPAFGFRFDLFLPPVPGVVRVVRHLLRDALAVGGLDANGPCLVLSELVTNALIHGGPPTVVLELRARRLHIAVADPGTGPVEALPVSTSRGGGRGMFLVNALADRWGVKTPSVGGKTVWCHLVVARA
ncbi:ATP-binding protein [Kitasatospora herbaricolor]|uniref:ATP-binding protein n=1 Tax=Kitasatospora herbaricolor TaxID=68217 RepID=UPI0036D8DEEC